MGLVSIGEFSRLSPKALRLYDELGLLVPDRVDAATGYRWYADTQLDQARVVALLRRIGVPLAQVKDMLALDPASAAERIGDYWASTEVEHAARRELVTRRAHEDEVMQIGREFSCTGWPVAAAPEPAGSPGRRSRFTTVR